MSTPSATTEPSRPADNRGATSARIKPLGLAKAWQMAMRLPFGRQIFSWKLRRAVPYSGSLGARVEALEPGFARVSLRDRKAVRNHLNSIHAIAQANLGELVTGLCLNYQIDGRGRGILRSIRTEYPRKARGQLTAECRFEVPPGSGTSVLMIEGTVRDAQGHTVATVQAEWQVELRA